MGLIKAYAKDDGALLQKHVTCSPNATTLKNPLDVNLISPGGGTGFTQISILDNIVSGDISSGVFLKSYPATFPYVLDNILIKYNASSTGPYIELDGNNGEFSYIQSMPSTYSGQVWFINNINWYIDSTKGFRLKVFRVAGSTTIDGYISIRK